MITASTIYWIGILDSVGCALTFLAFVFAIPMILFSIMWSARHFDREDTSLVRKAALGMTACFLILVIANALIPSTRLAAAMYLVPAIANNADVKAIGGNSLEALRLLTEDWLKDLVESKDDRLRKLAETPPSK